MFLGAGGQCAGFVQCARNFVVIGMGLTAAFRRHGCKQQGKGMFAAAGATEREQFVHGVGGKDCNATGEFDVASGIRVEFASAERPVEEISAAALVVVAKKISSK